MFGFFLNYTRNGGAEQYYYSLAKAFHSEYSKLEFYSGGGNSLPDDFILNKFPNMYISVNSFSELTWLKKIYFTLIPFITLYAGVKYFKKLRKMKYAICSHPFPTILALLLSRFFGFKVIKIVHHILPNELSAIELFFGKADVYIAVSHEVKDYLLTLGIKSHVIYNPIECDVAHVKTSRYKIIMLSHVHEDKSLSIEAFCSLANSYENYKFEIIGECTCDYALRLIKKVKNVKFHGSLPRQQAISYINENAKVFIGVGRSAVEAGMLGIPTIIAGHVKGRLGGNFAGLLNSNNLSKIAYNNYSGRSGSSLTSDMLEPCFQKLMEDKISNEELINVQRDLESKHNIENIKKLFEEYAL